METNNSINPAFEVIVILASIIIFLFIATIAYSISSIIPDQYIRAVVFVITLILITENMRNYWQKYKKNN